MTASEYRRSLGLVSLVSLGLGGTIGSGIFVAPGSAAGLAGPWSLLAWLLVGLSAAAVAYALAAVPPGATLFQFLAGVYGDRAADLLMAAYVASSLFGCASIGAGIGRYLGYFGLPGTLLLPAEILILTLFVLLNLSGIGVAGAAETLLTVVKVVPLALIALLLLPAVHVENFLPTSLVTLPGFVGALLVVWWPYTGFEIGAIPVEEARDPGLVRRAVLLVSGVTLALYLLLAVALVGSVGSDALAASAAPVAAAADLLRPGAGGAVGIVAIAAMLSAANAYLVAASRVVRDLADRRGLGGLARLSPRGTPDAALVVAGAVPALLLIGSNRFELLAALAVVLVLGPYLALCLAIRKTSDRRAARTAGALGASATGLYLALSGVALA